MQAIDYVVKDGSGYPIRGILAGDDGNALLDMSGGQQISLNLHRYDVANYARQGGNLEILLTDGRAIVLQDFFAGDAPNKLYLSAEGDLSQVMFTEADGSATFSQYADAGTWGKWSPSDDLIFVGGDEVLHAASGEGTDDTVAMLAPGLLLGAGGLGLLGSGAAAAGLAAILGGGDDDDDGGSSGGGGDAIAVTVNDGDAVITSDEATQTVDITGTAPADSTVVVTVGDSVLETTADSDGNWAVQIDSDTLPSDGNYDVAVVATDPDGVVTELTGPNIMVDTTPPETVVTEGVQSTDDIVNGDDYDDGVEIKGTGEPGSTVTVIVGDSEQTTTVGGKGNWSVSFDDTQVDAGEYETEVTIVSTDTLGNSITTTEVLVIDTVPHPIAINADTVEGDGVVNAVEASDGVKITGTSTPGAEVTVTIAGVTQTVTTGGKGNWKVTFDAADVPAGEYEAEITASTVDAAGNASSVSETITIDTLGSVAFDAGAIAGDNVINLSELSGGVTVTGTAEAGSTVMIEAGGMVREADVDADGNWSINYTAADFETGEYSADLVVSATDAAGNVTTDTRTISIDTETSGTIDAGFAGADGTINAAEAEAGVTLTGTAEAGATIEVTLDGVSKTMTVGDDGLWSVDYAAGEIASGVYTADVTLTVIDAAGNTYSEATTVDVDTTADVAFDDVPVTADNVVNATEAAGGITLTGTTAVGSTVVVTMGADSVNATVAADGSWSVEVPAAALVDGTVSATAVSTSAAGNTATATRSFDVDTQTEVAFGDLPIEGDGTINAAEAADGVTLSGTAEAGASVDVTLNGVTVAATVADDGSWSADFDSATVGTGTATLSASVTSTDAAGNTASATTTMLLDTEALVAIDPNQVGDGVINANEAAAGVTLTGTSEAGSTVEVTLDGHTVTATVAADGTWSADFPTEAIAEGVYDATVTAVATDAVGNTDTTTGTVAVDTTNPLSIDISDFEGDGVANEEEVADGVILTGTAEPGADVTLEVGGTEYDAAVDDAGVWTVEIPADVIAAGEYDADVTVTSVDEVGNEVTATGVVRIDTLVQPLNIDTPEAAADGYLNADELAVPLVVTGKVEPGASVEVTIDGVTKLADVTTDGTWTATYEPGDLADGEYTAAVSVVATDAAGNTREVTGSVNVDTDAGVLTISADPIEGDDVVNGEEWADGVVITGTATPGAVVDVTAGSVTHTVTADADGNWETTYTPAEIPEGDYEMALSATTTDVAGNTIDVSDSVAIDTALDPLTIQTPVEGDDVINAVEASDGVTLTGMVEPGSTVHVTVDGKTQAATVAADGTWSAGYAASAIAAGEWDTTVTVTAVDAAGNQRVLAHDISIDTLVTDAAIHEVASSGESFNKAEVADGIELTGTTEPGASVMVTFQGITRAATVAADGTWTVAYDASEITPGEYEADVTVDMTDAAGNTLSLVETVIIDTVEPITPVAENLTYDTAGDTTAISMSQAVEPTSVSVVKSDGTFADADYVATDIDAIGSTIYSFADPVDDGDDLIVTTEDAAGNSSATYIALDDTADTTVAVSDIVKDGFNIDAIDLSFASDAELTLTEAQILAMSGNSDTLTVHGNSDDTVELTGATDTGTTTDIEGQTYSIYTIGDDGAMLVVDDDIDVII